MARHDHRPRPRCTGKHRHHHESQSGSRSGTFRRHVVDRARTFVMELVERHRRPLHDPRRRKAGDRHRIVTGHRIQHHRRRLGRTSRQMEIPAGVDRIRRIPRRGAIRMAPLGETQRPGGRLPPDARLSGLGRSGRHKGCQGGFHERRGHTPDRLQYPPAEKCGTTQTVGQPPRLPEADGRNPHLPQ